jgi:hypothetical protein
VITEQYSPLKFSTFENLKKVVDSKAEIEHLSFDHVTPKQFESIKARREDLGHVLFTYFGDIETLIIKLPSEAHERAHRTLGDEILLQARAVMQLHRLEFMSVGSTEYRGSNTSNKESDSCWKNVRIRVLWTDQY